MSRELKLMARVHDLEALVLRMQSAYFNVRDLVRAKLEEDDLSTEDWRRVMYADAVLNCNNRTNHDAKARAFGVVYGAGPQTIKKLLAGKTVETGGQDDGEETQSEEEGACGDTRRDGQEDGSV